MNMHANPPANDAAVSRRRDDKELIALCQKAKSQLEEDHRHELLQVDIREVFESKQPKRPLDVRYVDQERSSAEMKRMLRELTGAGAWPPAKTSEYKAGIQKIEAWEREVKALRDSTGLSDIERICNRLSIRSMTMVRKVAAMPALTMVGLASKAALLHYWDRAGYGFSTTAIETLILSVADDARTLGTGYPRSTIDRRASAPVLQAAE